VKLSFIVVSTVPAVIAGVVLTLGLTGTTLNIQSFMGAIMAIGVAVANAILLVTFAERRAWRRASRLPRRAASCRPDRHQQLPADLNRRIRSAGRDAPAHGQRDACPTLCCSRRGRWSAKPPAPHPDDERWP